MLTRLAVGGRISLTVGVGVEAIVLLVGGTVGSSWPAYYGQVRPDTLLMRLTDMMFAFPDILLAILIMATQGRSLLQPVSRVRASPAGRGWPGSYAGRHCRCGAGSMWKRRGH